jgi:hypothetical protein
MWIAKFSILAIDIHSGCYGGYPGRFLKFKNLKKNKFKNFVTHYSYSILVVASFLWFFSCQTRPLMCLFTKASPWS